MIRSRIYVPSIGAHLFFCWLVFLSNFNMMTVLSYCILFSYVLWYHLEVCYFLMRHRKVAYPEGRGGREELQG